MTIFVAILLTVITFAFVIYPLFKQRLPSADSAEGEKRRELDSRRDTSYSMLKELEFDFQSGILSKEDYNDLEARYRGKAISILRSIDEFENSADVEEEIEKEVQELRRGAGQFCTKCGTKYEAGDRFCSRCGANLGEGSGS